MAPPALDTAAWTGRWRCRSTTEKVLLTGGLLTLSVTAPTPAFALVVAAVAVVAALLCARVPSSTYARALAAPAGFVLLGAVTISLTLDPADQVLLQLGPLYLTETSLDRAMLVTGRALAGAAAVILLASTTPMIDLLTGLRSWRVPDALLDVAALTYRMLFSLLEASSTIRASQAARLGFVSGPAARRSVGLLAAAVLVRSWRRARALEDGLAGRGYDGALLTLPPHRPVAPGFVAVSLVVLASLAAWSVMLAGG